METKYYPTCIASSRTCHDFLARYEGNAYLYEPTPQEGFGHKKSALYYIDDYRNPVCAAIGMTYKLGVSKLMLFCCDDSFEEERDAAMQLDNNLWIYPQHLKSHKIIDSNLYWLTNQKNHEVDVCDFSSGSKYVNAQYINSEEQIINFFNDDDDDNENNDNNDNNDEVTLSGTGDLKNEK